MGDGYGGARRVRVYLLLEEPGGRAFSAVVCLDDEQNLPNDAQLV